MPCTQEISFPWNQWNTPGAFLLYYHLPKMATLLTSYNLTGLVCKVSFDFLFFCGCNDDFCLKVQLFNLKGKNQRFSADGESALHTSEKVSSAGCSLFTLPKHILPACLGFKSSLPSFLVPAKKNTTPLKLEYYFLVMYTYVHCMCVTMSSLQPHPVSVKSQY